MNVEKQWKVYRTRFLVRACQLTQPMVFTDALGREHSGQPGDYLVESSEGCFRITPRMIFEDVYVPLSSPPPQPAHGQQAELERAIRILDGWAERRFQFARQRRHPLGLGPRAASCVDARRALALSG